jgi:hypothetical protein
MIDVTVVQPTCPTWLKRHTDTKTLVAASSAAKEKQRHYDEKARAMDAQFIPIALEANGGIDGNARLFFKKLAWFAHHPSCPWTRNEALRAIVSSVAVAIQVGNMRIVDRVLLQNCIGRVSSLKRPQPLAANAFDHVEHPPLGANLDVVDENGDAADDAAVSDEFREVPELAEIMGVEEDAIGFEGSDADAEEDHFAQPAVRIEVHARAAASPQLGFGSNPDAEPAHIPPSTSCNAH